VIEQISDVQRGLILVTGATGSGKSTTLAAMIRTASTPPAADTSSLSKTPSNFFILIKRPSLRSAKSMWTQGHLPSTPRSAETDPDVILVGEMRDYETIETALTAAETGHLVLSTLHTLDATETITRIVSSFPSHQQKSVRLQLAGILKAVISMRLGASRPWWRSRASH